MTLVQYLWGAGPEGGSVTNANSGSTASSLTNSSTSTYAAAGAAHGSFGMKIDCKTASQAFRRYTFSGGVGATNWASSVVITMPAAAPGNTVPLLNAATSADAARLQMRVTASGNLELTDVGGAHSGTIATGVSWGAKYRVTLVVTGGSTTTGSVSAKVYSGTTSWTTQVGSTFTASNWNLGVEQVNRFDIGVTANSAAAVILYLDDLQVNDGATAEISDVTSNTAPTANAGVDQTVLPGVVCTLDGTSSTDPESNTLTYAWTPPGGVTLSSNTASQPTFTTPYAMTQQTYTFSLVVTDTGALSSASDSVVVTVPPHPEWYHNGGTWKPEIISSL